MIIYSYPEQSEEAVQSQKQGRAYLLQGPCVVCGVSITVQACIYGFEPRCERHTYIYERNEQGFDRLGIPLIEVRTAPFTSTILVDPNYPGREYLYSHGKPVPSTPGYLYLGCPAIIHRMACESAEEHRQRAQQEAEASVNNGFYRDVEW